MGIAHGTCTRPPTGWWCSREDGHDGPCPTRREALPLDRRPLWVKRVHSVATFFSIFDWWPQ